MEANSPDENILFAQRLFTLVNAQGNDKDLAKALMVEFDRQHRTLIQSAMGVFKAVIEKYAETAQSDLRNADSLEWAKEVAKLKEQDKFYCFRYI